MQKFKANGMPYRGQLLALKYFYEVEKNTIEKSNGSIGIIPFIWQRSKDYYEKQAKKADDITASIQKQLEKDRAEIKITPGEYFKTKKKKKTIDLNSIEEG
jgi:cytochrome c556